MNKYTYMSTFFVVVCLMSWPIAGLAQEAESTPKPLVESEPQEENASMEKLNINFASIEDLLLLTGGGEELAQLLADGRPYAALDDILTIEGIGEETFAEIRDVIEIRKLNLNNATPAELMLLPGIDEALAHAIIEHQPYEIVEKILTIPGISEDSLKEFQAFIKAEPVPPARRGWNIKRRSVPLNVERPLKKRRTKEDDDFFNAAPNDEDGE